MKILYFFLIIHSISETLSQIKPPVVQTPLGGVKGYFKKSFTGKKYEAFEGVPYAKPPLGKRRFQPPESIGSWIGNLTATKVSENCIQLSHFPVGTITKVFGSEDCLYLNIYSPAKKSKSRLLPVLFALHGGAFHYSSAPKEVSYLLDRNIVVVTLNHRLGPFGFLSTEDEVVPGNMGLKDQNMALKWVSNNIRFFGGDPGRVTLIGVSSGAASVHYHYLSPMSKGLFQNGISVSGSALSPGKHAENLREKTLKIARIVGCPSTKNIGDTVECLRNKPAGSIIEATKHFFGWSWLPLTVFGPVVEKTADNPFLNRSAIEIISSGDAADVPWFTSLVSEEGIFPVGEYINNDTHLKDLNDNWERIAPHLLDFNFTIPLNKHAEVARKIRSHYFGTKQINRRTAKELINCVGDRLYNFDSEKAIRLMAKVNKSPVYFYYYSYRALESRGDSLTLSKKNYGVCHSDDWDLVLELKRSGLKRPKDRLMQIKLIDYVTSIMEKGYPDVGVKWKKVDPSKKNLEFLHFAGPDKLKMEEKSNLGEKSFWSTIDFDENKLPTI